MEGELADDKHLTRYVEEGEVHFSIRIREDPHLGDFLAEPFDVGLVVGGFNTEEDEEALGDGGNGVAVNFHGSGGDTLEQGAHGSD